MLNNWKSRVLLSCMMFAALLMSAHAADYPVRRITLVAPYAAGGGFDGVARILAEALGRNLGQTVIVENVEGGGGIIGARQVANATPDGYTLLMNHMGMATAPLLVKNLGFDPIDSFAPIGLFVRSPALLIGRKDLPANSAPELIAYLKTKGADATVASSGVGSGTDLCADLFEQSIGVNPTHIQYRGAGPAMIDVEASRVDLLCETPFGLISHVRSGATKAFVVSGDTRLDSLPDVPTAKELGLQKFSLAVTWYGLYAPAKTPDAVVARLSSALQAAVRDPSVLERMKMLGMDPYDQSQATPEGLRQFLSSQIALLKDVFQQAGITPQ